MSHPYLEITGLKKNYGLKPVLRGVDLAVERGQRVALLGANGAGKTTLLRVLAGLTEPDAGKVCIGGLDITRDGLQARRLIGFVSHQPYLYDDLTVVENLHFFGRMYAVKQRKERASILLERVGLAKRASERASSLSRGQSQRLALARALLHAPRLLLLDEPDTGLDEDGITLLETLLNEHARDGGAVLFTTHQLEHAMQWSDRIGLLNGGRMAYQRETREVEAGSVRQAYQEALR
ncbi:MAG TPA: heme ABC exporter ATP-binding protein CcmA [Ktedonobacteraceae bacterium]|nr:heme ABC exporter ATP-binding protein CcmA [Ktedonobacteraceae bacterium]